MAGFDSSISKMMMGLDLLQNFLDHGSYSSDKLGPLRLFLIESEVFKEDVVVADRHHVLKNVSFHLGDVLWLRQCLTLYAFHLDFIRIKDEVCKESDQSIP